MHRLASIISPAQNAIEGARRERAPFDASLRSRAALWHVEPRTINSLVLEEAQFSRYAAEDGIAFIDAYIADNPAYWVYCDLVNASKRAVAEASPLNVVIDTVGEGLSCAEEPEDAPDLAHYDSQSEIRLGHLFIEELSHFMEGSS